MFTSMVTYILPLAHILMTANIYFTLAITLERYTTVCHPFYKVILSDLLIGLSLIDQSTLVFQNGHLILSNISDRIGEI